MSTPFIMVQKEILKQLKEQFPTKFVAMYQSDKLGHAKRACLLNIDHIQYQQSTDDDRTIAQCEFHAYCMSAKTAMHDTFALTDFAIRTGLYVQQHGNWLDGTLTTAPTQIDIQPHALAGYAADFWVMRVAWQQGIYLNESYWKESERPVEVQFGKGHYVPHQRL